MSLHWPLRRAAAGLALVGSLSVPTPPFAGAQTSTEGGPRVVAIEHRIIGIVRRVESIKGEIRTVESPQQVEVTLAADVLFAFDRADLTEPAADRIREVGAQITAKSSGPVAVVGYTDSKGTSAYNDDLSLRRATAVQAGLQPLVPGVAIQVSGKGAADPVAPNTNPDGSDNPDGRALNRRVTITFARNA